MSDLLGDVDPLPITPSSHRRIKIKLKKLKRKHDSGSSTRLENETNNNDEDYLSKKPQIFNQSDQDSQEENPFDQLLMDALELLDDIKLENLAETLDLRPCDLPNMNDFDNFERCAFEGLKYFEKVDEIEKHDHSMSEPTKIKREFCKNTKNGSGKVIHECRVCGEAFMVFGDFIQHEESHMSDFTCQICGKMLRNSNQLRSHLESHRTRPEDREEPCKEQGSPAQVQQSSVKVRTFSCKSCADVYDTKSELIKHQILRHDMYRISQGNYGNIAWLRKQAQIWSKVLSYSQVSLRESQY